MQGVNSTEARVLTLGATNIPYGLDQAVRRRFDKVIDLYLFWRKRVSYKPDSLFVSSGDSVRFEAYCLEDSVLM